MRKPTAQPASRPAIRATIKGGAVSANCLRPYQTTTITAPNTTSVTARQKKTAAGLKVEGLVSVPFRHPTATHNERKAS